MSSPIAIDWNTGALSGAPVGCSIKKLFQVRDLFLDQDRAATMDPETILYRVQHWLPVAEGTAGGLCWGTTVIEPGRVGDEYFMTHGHFHATRDRAEFYATIQGRGALILMDESGVTHFEPMESGSLHYIPAKTAHRVANTGDTQLVFVTCCPSDAGHDYESIRDLGFGARLLEVDGRPALIAEHG
jgi:glucose-6-phosphate isomerase, archaeal